MKFLGELFSTLPTSAKVDAIEFVRRAAIEQVDNRERQAWAAAELRKAHPALPGAAVNLLVEIGVQFLKRGISEAAERAEAK